MGMGTSIIKKVQRFRVQSFRIRSYNPISLKERWGFLILRGHGDVHKYINIF
jgi:hypothetical protein